MSSPPQSPQPASGHAWGLISDIHGNYAALVEALAVLERAGATRLAFLGDYLGRGNQDRCAQTIRDVAEVAIVGNRDLDWQDRVGAASKAWVLGLPSSVCVDGLLLTHGDARLTPALSTAQIGRDFQRAWSELDRFDARVWAFGHSHFARTWRKSSAAVPAEAQGAAQTTIEPAYRYMVNVGTTGLPFPGKGGPSVTLLDFAHRQISHLPLARTPRE